MKAFRARHILKAAAAIAIVCLFAFGARRPQKYTDEYYGLFDTYISFTAYARTQKEFRIYSDAAHDELERLHRLFDIYNSYDGINNIRSINENAGISPVKVDADVLALIKKAADAYRETDGTVNAAMGPVLKIWHEYREKASIDEQNAMLPPISELKKAAELCDIGDVIIDEEKGTVFLKKMGMSLDVGSMAKGYAAAAAAEKAKQAGMASGILNAGGNVVTVGKPEGREYWNVAIESPDHGDSPTEILGIRDLSVVTSGDYQRFYTVDGVRYNHIVDASTLMPAIRYRAVTVIHNDSATADILSTAAFIMPLEKAKLLVEAHGGEAVWFLPDGETTATAGYADIPHFKDGSMQ